MADQYFTHLHLHTEFSLLDGAISLDKLIKYGKDHNLKSLGISDHGNIFGAVKFFQKCKKAGIKPVLGIEAYITEDANIKSIDNKYHHLLLIVENEIGYKNLCKLISFSFQKGFYFKPRIDYNILEKHAEGLIASTACLGGHIPQLLLKDQEEEANKRIDWFARTFGPERFYLEVQPEDQEEQKIVNQKLYEISAKKNLPLLAATDCHYISQEDREAHEVMLCIQTHGKLTDPDRYTFGDCHVYMRNEEEMLEIFKDHPEAVYNSGKIADRCTFDFQTDKLFFPQFEIPENHTQESFFKELCQTGLRNLIDKKMIDAEKEPSYQERLDEEMNLIISMGFVGYFLVVSDFIQWSKQNNVPVGPGRGSAAGSLVAWCLQITNIDPLKYNLLFERFLNPERVTMPDIDIDFCINGRERAINYVRDKYGHDKVCQIITFGTMMAKGVIKDVARVLGLPFEDSNAITNMIPDQLKISLREAIEQEPKLKELIDSNPKVAHIFDIAFRLEGLTRHASKHAAGIVISPDPIDEVLPVYVPPKTTDLVTQYAMTELESIGFLKIDFLGLKNLTLIDNAVRMIKENHGVELNMDAIPLDDTKAFELICQGNTSGVFQLESDGLKDVLRRLQPEKFEDIIAVNALYRPGPLGSGMVDDFIERRHGRAKIEYLLPELEPILKETYGVIVYQEQVMKIASAVAGYSLGQSDILRRAMGKKKVEVMAEQREIFMTESGKRNVDPKKAGQLFDLMAYFAGYGFNKSHSAAYAMIAYQTAYLKANYTAEYLACLLTLESTNAEKLSFYLEEVKSIGLSIIAPNINKSQIQFSVVDGKILFGLQGIKNVGNAALENIIAQREKDGPYTDMLDFCSRIDLRTSNKRVIESLICAGAFDLLPGNRAQQFTELSTIIERAIELKHRRETGQMDLFGNNTNDDQTTDPYAFQPLSEWDDKYKLEKEKEVIGFYISAHPLDSYKPFLNKIKTSSFATLFEQSQKSLPGDNEPIVTGAGLIKTHRVINTKKGDKMAFAQLEDKDGVAEIVIFPRLFKKIENWLDSYHVFVVKGSLDSTATSKCKIKANDMVPAELFFDEWPRIESATLKLPRTIESTAIDSLKKNLSRGAVNCQFMFYENGKRIVLRPRQKIKIDQDTVEHLEKNNIDILLHLG